MGGIGGLTPSTSQMRGTRVRKEQTGRGIAKARCLQWGRRGRRDAPWVSKGTPLGIAVRDNATAWLLGGARGWLLLPCPFPGTELSCILRPHSRRPLARPVCPAQAGPFLVACSALELQLIPGDLALSKDRRPGLGCWDRAVAVTAVPVLARVTPGAARGPATPSVHPLVPGGSLWAPLTAAPVALQQCP